MRPPVDERRIRQLADELARVAPVPVRLYLTGGSTAVIQGWRASTIDVDLRFEPEGDELLRALPTLKERLGINIELVSPPDFIPELPGWRDRSPFVFRDGNVDVHHFDRVRLSWRDVYGPDLLAIRPLRGRVDASIPPAGGTQPVW